MGAGGKTTETETETERVTDVKTYTETLAMEAI